MSEENVELIRGFLSAYEGLDLAAFWRDTDPADMRAIFRRLGREQDTLDVGLLALAVQQDLASALLQTPQRPDDQKASTGTMVLSGSSKKY